MPVKAADPSAVSLDAAFAAAMDTPGAPREPGPPPEVDRDAPFGRAEDGSAIAPHGLTKDGKPKLSAAGRKPAAEEKARVTTAGPQAGAADAKGSGKGKTTETAPEAGKYAPAIAETLETLWLGGTVIGTVGPDLPVVGKLIPAVQVQAQAAVILTFRDNIAGALDICAQHNEQARKLAQKCQSGNAGWALNAAFMMLPVVSASLQVWGKQEREFDAETGKPLPTLAEQLAEQNAAQFKAYMDKLAKQAEAAAEAANGTVPAHA